MRKKLYSGVYDAKTMDGIPVGAQSVGPAWHEVKVLKIMQVLNEALASLYGKQFRQGLAGKHLYTAVPPALRA